jgi:hypothetical protein
MFRKILAISMLLGLSSQVAFAAPNWKSGSNGTKSHTFATWRGSPIQVAVGWAPRENWAGMLAYMSDSNPRQLRGQSSNVSIGVGLFPRNGGNLADCAANKYAGYHKSMGDRLRQNGVGDAEIRLGWEASGSSFPWSAVGKSPAQWKACFINAARAMKAGSSNLRIAWHMSKKPKMDVRTIWPEEAKGLITNIGVSHYDDNEARFGTEMAPNGSPWGLRAWLAFAKSKGKKLEIAEWGVGRAGDNPSYIEKMHDFFSFAGSGLAHEGYLNGNIHVLYAATRFPKASKRYRELF